MSEAISEREKQLEAILQTAADAIITIDESGVILSANPATERMFGYAVEELYGENVKILMPSPYQEEHDKYLSNYQETRHAKIIGIGREVVAKRKDGTTFPIDLAISEATVGSKRIFTGIIRDASDRKLAAVLQAELGRILESSLNEVFVFDAETLKFLNVNRGACHNIGYTLDDLRQMSPVDIKPYHTAETFSELILPLVNGQEDMLVFETEHCRKDGSHYDVEVHLQKTTYQGRPAFFAIILDITNRKQAEIRAAQAERLAAIGQVATSMAHESRNFLQRISCSAEMLLEIDKDDPDAIEEIACIQRAEKGLEHLLEELRQFAAPTNLERKRCSLQEIWRDAWLDVKANNKAARRVQFAEVTNNLDLHCDVDAFRVSQVFRNLFENSVAAFVGGVAAEIQVHCSNDGGRLTIAIRDNGPGLNSDQRRKVFEPFYTTKAKGTGLGMAIVKRIVEAHGGDIRLGADSLDGAEFVLTLPV
ncbi:PAS domain S-box protein [Planctomycetes bacterium K23_9]|uniref:Sensor protein FixL n=1 Tax=Stieleria marina TaxID=1930275 RepID=A0A517NZY4_9BACT|nr:Sensor protein FixL [Planctomycetes bacterium K23_9]